MRTASIALLVILFAAPIAAQDNDVELELTIGGSIPLQPTLENGQEVYQIGPAVKGSGFFPLSSRMGLYGAARLGFISSATYADKPFNLISLSPGLELRRQIHRLVLGAEAYAGMYVGMYDGESAFDLMLQAGPSLRFLLTPALTLGLSGNYIHCFADSFSRTLYSGIGVSLGSSYSFGAGQGTPQIDYRDIRLNPIFPVFHAYYDDHALGELTITNSSRTDVRDLEVTFFTTEYMDQPKECFELDRLAAGAAADVPLYGLFNKQILATTEGTKVPCEISVSYTYLGQTRTVAIRESLTINNRNAMTWDDDRKAASFITARDEDILRFAKSTASFVRDNRSRIVNRTFRTAVGMLRAMDHYGLRYVIDPSTPYKSFSADATAVDYLQFPAQTLSFGGGDCDDLSILYAAMLESVGVETAFITVPGHIFLAFNAGVNPKEAGDIFVNDDDLILSGEKCWIPVEVTMLNESFLTAWKEGARKWRQYASTDKANLLPVRSAWEVYEPVDRPPLNTQIKTFEPREMKRGFFSDLEQITSFQLQDRVHELKRNIARGGEDRKVFINKLGVLYARYGLFDSAKGQFERVIAENYFPAVLNLGNIHYLEGDYESALRLYRRALEIKQDNSLAHIGIARTQYELEEYRAAETAYVKARESDPSAAARFSYLASTGGDSRTRAADSEAREERMLWDY